MMTRYERTNVTQNVTQLRERYKAIQEMIADAQRSPKDHLDHLDEDEEEDHKDDDHKDEEDDNDGNDEDDHDEDEEDNDGCVSERTKLTGGASSGEGGRSGQNVQTSPPDVEPPTWKLKLFWDLEPGISRLEFTSKCPHLTAQPE